MSESPYPYPYPYPATAKEIFLAALDLRLDRDRPEFIRRACGEDLGLLARVEALLAAHDESGGVLKAVPIDPKSELSRTVDSPAHSTEGEGTVIAGRYRLLELVGEGGMGSVWVAQQTEPVRRKVAVKLIKPGMDSKLVLARFQIEKQALAMMDHPNIAKVLDGGMCEQGRPYFVMEYVKGVPITQFCDDSRLTLPDRLQLFIQVCQAVQHAHQKGIIHRDLKPSNILVCLYDGLPVPKVIDFGLAKAMHQSLSEQSIYTAHGVMVGTPLYMSPEQAEFNNLDIDTRSDIYSLGVVLYELLTGTTPLERQQLKDAMFQEVLRLIKEVDPPKPSARLSGSASLPSVAAQRRLEPGQLPKSVQGDLDWIVMKSLEKERSRRYETANGLARDIERYLHDEAVEACPPSAAYRWKKFVRKYRLAIRTTATFVLILTLATGVSSWLAVRAMRAERLADQRAAESLASATHAERAEMATMEAYRASTDDAIEELIGSKEILGPQEKSYLEKTIGRWLVFASRAGEDQRSRTVRAEGHQRVGLLWSKFGDQAKAAEQLTVARELAADLVRDYPTDDQVMFQFAAIRVDLATVYNRNSQNAFAEREAQAAIALLQNASKSNPDNSDVQLRLAESYRSAAVSLESLGKLDEAKIQLLTALKLSHLLLQNDPDSVKVSLLVSNCHKILARIQEQTANMDEAVQNIDRAISVLQAVSVSNSNVKEELASSHNIRAIFLANTGKDREATTEYQIALKLRNELALEFPAVPSYRKQLADAHNNLATQWFRDSPDNALSEFKTALEIRRSIAAAHPTVPMYQRDLAHCHTNLSHFYLSIGRSSDALSEMESAIAIDQQLVKIHPEVLDFSSGLANDYTALGAIYSAEAKLDRVLTEFDKAHQIRSSLAERHPTVPALQRALASSHIDLSSALMSAGKSHEAMKEIDAAIEIDQKLVLSHPEMPDFKIGLASDHNARGGLFEAELKRDEAIEEFNLALKIDLELARQFPSISDHKTRLASRHAQLGSALVGRERIAEGLAELEAYRDVWIEKVRDNPENLRDRITLARAYEVLSRNYYRAGRPADALRQLQLAYDIYKEIADGHPDSREYELWKLNLQGDLAARSGAWHDAIRAYAESVELQPTNHYYWYLGAFARARFGDREEYGRHCQAMLDPFGATTIPYVANRVAKACSLMATSKVDTALVCQLAEDSVAKVSETDEYRDHLLSGQSMALYRNGQFERAIEVATKALSQPGVDHGVIEAPSYLVTAMAHWRLGHGDEAQQALKMATEKLAVLRKAANNANELVSVFWHDELMGLLLLQECEALLAESPPNPK